MTKGSVSPWLVGLVLVFSLGAPTALATTGELPLQATPSTCFGLNNVDDSRIPGVVASLRIAVVEPVLTSTPYSQYKSGSFYAFYTKEQGVTSNLTTDLNLLSTNVSSGLGFNHGWGLSAGMYIFLASQAAKDCGLELGKNVQVLTDIDVANGGLFHPGNDSARFDAVIMPFTEYVETQEYSAYERFVAGGGTMVMMSHSLEYPVSYNATTGMETLVYGHGWAFNGRYAYRIPCNSNTYAYKCPWAVNNTDWTGSNTCMASCYHTYKYNGSVVDTLSPVGAAMAKEFGGTIFRSYVAHEENSVTNRTGTSVVSVFVNDSTNLIAAYTHQFRRGEVFCYGVFADDIIATDPSAQYFLLQGLVSAKAGPAPAQTSSTTAATSASRSVQSTSSSSASTTTPPPLQPGGFPVVLAAVGGAVVALVVGGAVLVLRGRQRALFRHGKS